MPDPTNAEDVARWACGITLGLTGPIADTFDTTRYFATADHQFFYANVFNQATAYQIQKYTSFTWKCCMDAADLKAITTGRALVVLIESHLIAKPAQVAATAMWSVAPATGAGEAEDEGAE
ncbi:MAG: hypothetical protein ABI837_08075 [Acidobacteriota bacterium]